MKTLPLFALASLFFLGSAHASGEKTYDTVTKAEYVFSCMLPKGGSPADLRECACSIDMIEKLLPLEKYIQAETFLRMRLTHGEKSSLFRETEKSKKTLDEFRAAVVIAEEKCFSL